MNSDIILKLDEIISIIDNSNDVKRYSELKDALLKDESLINDIKKVKDLNMSYDQGYVELKENIMSNEKFRNLKSIENDLYFLVQEINVKFKEVLKEVK